ncbi:unnamed protein product [Macrosiphum euphorbiae]|uniref:Uncharacterized protein n=1 Tax=Macrosiphum euphorbiae TaxID=13131 RepID=A0AAV0YCA8_9HEMI|nr:unnamed protein product [Macrosiphum euphorbiae]
MHDKSLLNCNPNEIIDSNCHNTNIVSISSVTVNNDNSVLDNTKNPNNINGVSCLINEPSVKETKCATKASHTILSTTADLNLKHTQSNLTASDKNESIENSTKKIGSINDLDGTASPSSDIQWPIKLSQSAPYSHDLERNSNVLYKHTADGSNQKCSPNETGLAIIKKSTLIQLNQQFQNEYNFIAKDNLSPTIQSGSETIGEKTQIQFRADNSFESISRTEPTDHQEMYRNTIIPSHQPECTNSKKSKRIQCSPIV